jgi:hypothetical protein
MRTLAASLTVALTLLITSVASGLAQDATPVAPNPELCTLEPVSIERLLSIIATPTDAVQPDEFPEGTPVTLPAGDPVDEETQQRVEESMTINIACINTGDPLLQLAVYSEEGMKRLLGTTEDLSDEQIAGLQTPTPLQESAWTVIYEVSEAIDLGDDGVAIRIVGDDPVEDGPPVPILFILVEQDGHWLIDAFERTED